MKKLAGAAATLAATTTLATAGGLDRAGNNLGPLFEDGNYVEFSFGAVNPSVSGTDAATLGTGDVASGYAQFSLGYKQQINENLSFSLLIDQPYGADVSYLAGPAAGGTGSAVFGGTRANVNSESVSFTGRYKFDNGFSVHGGLRAQSLEAEVALGGAGFGPLNGFNATFDRDIGYGYHIGGAFERPDIALRVALTYFSEIEHNADTRESFAPGVVSNTEITTPEAFNLDFQTGIAEDTLLFGQIRYVDWESVSVVPVAFGNATGGASLVGIENSTTYTLGIGRRFNEAFSGAVSIQYEDSGDPLVSPLGPSNGRLGISIGGTYTQGPMKITGGINYTDVGDATPRTAAGTAGANFTGNKSIGAGFRIGYSF